MTCTRINIEGNSMPIFEPPQLGSIALPEGVILRCFKCGNQCHDFGHHCQALIFPELLGRKSWKAVRLIVDCDICNSRENAVLDFETEEVKAGFVLPFQITLPGKSEIYCGKCRQSNTGRFVLKVRKEQLVLALACGDCKTLTMPIIWWL